MEGKRKVYQVFNNNPQGSRLREQPKTDGGTTYTDINKWNIENWKAGQKAELTGRSSLRRRRSALDCGAIQGGGEGGAGEEEEDEEEGGGG
jgi:hypothetical protein